MDIGNRPALHPQKHKGHQECGQAVEVARPSRKDDQSDVTPTSHGMRIPPRFPKPASNPKHRGADLREEWVCCDTKRGRP